MEEIWNETIKETADALADAQSFVVVYLDSTGKVQANVYQGVNKSIIQGLTHMRDFLAQQLDLQQGTVRWLVADILQMCA